MAFDVYLVVPPQPPKTKGTPEYGVTLTLLNGYWFCAFRPAGDVVYAQARFRALAWTKGAVLWVRRRVGQRLGRRLTRLADWFLAL